MSTVIRSTSTAPEMSEPEEPPPLLDDAVTWGELADLYNERYGFYRSLARRLSSSPERADEIVQDAFVKTYAASPAGLSLSELSAYVATAVVNAARTDRRHLGVVTRLLGRRVSYEKSAEFSGTEYIEPHLADAPITEALRSLSARQRQAIVLRYWMDLSVAETSRAMEVSQGTAKRHLQRGLARLSEKLRSDSTTEDGHQPGGNYG